VYLATIEANAYARAAAELERRIAQRCALDAAGIVSRFRELDRDRYAPAGAPA